MKPISQAPIVATKSRDNFSLVFIIIARACPIIICYENEMNEKNNKIYTSVEILTVHIISLRKDLENFTIKAAR